MASFSTVCLVKESPEVVRRFVDFYGAAGANAIFVYTDGPAPELRALDGAGLALTEADDAFWADRLGGRPAILEVRIIQVIQDALRRCQSDWLLTIDSDEFVFGDRPIPAFLDGIPAGADSVAVPSAEAVWGPGDPIDTPFGSSYFRTVWRRTKLWNALGGLVYGRIIASDMQRGLTGHTAGKQFLRTGRSYDEVRHHSASRDGRSITRLAAEIDPRLAGMYLGHYDAIGFDRWREKWRRRIEKDTLTQGMTERRQSQMRLIAGGLAAGDAEARALFRAFYGLSRPQYALLSGLGYAFRREIFSAP